MRSPKTSLRTGRDVLAQMGPDPREAQARLNELKVSHAEQSAYSIVS